MWYAIVFVIAIILFVVFAPKPNVENARPAKFGDLQFPRSKYGDAIPMVWGTVRQKSPIVAWFGDYAPTPIYEKVKSGLFSSKKVIIGHRTILGLDLVLCLGPGVKLKKIWADTYEVWQGNVSASDISINLQNLFGGLKKGGGLRGTVTFYDGGFSPAQDAYLIEKISSDVPAYNGLARLVFKSFYFGTGTTPKPISCEISRLPTGLHATFSIMPNGLDCNPMEVAYDAITSKWGRLGNLPTELNLASFLSCAETLYDEGVGMSLLVQAQITGKDLLEEVMRVADGLLYQDPATSEIVAKLIRADYDIETIPVFDKSSVKTLRNFQKTTWENTFNQCRVTFKDRASNYDDSVALAQDFANINFQSRIKSTDINMPGCADAETAAKLAARQLSLLNVPLYKCDLTINRKAQSLRPGDVFILNWEPYNIQNMVMRVAKIDFGELTSNEIKLSCVQDRFASDTVTFAQPEPSSWVPPVSTALDVEERLLFTPPAFLASQDADSLATFDTFARLYCAAVAPAGASLAFDAMLSFDNFATEPVTSLEGANYSGGGTLAANYSATTAQNSRHDTTGITVENVSAASLTSLKNLASISEARDGSTLLLINNELFVYVGFTDNEDGSVTFDNIYRSVLDTAPEAHADGDRVWFIGSADGLLPELLQIGQTGYVKLLDQTPGDFLDIADATTFSHTVTNRAGRPLPPAYLTLAGSRTPSPGVGLTSVAVAWRNRSRLDTTLRVYNDTTDTREAGTQTRVRWRVGGGGYTTVTTTGNNTSLNVTALTGTLEVIVDSQIISNSVYSLVSDTLTMELT